MAMALGKSRPLELRQLRAFFSRAHVNPNEPGPLLDWIGANIDFFFEITFGGFIGHVDTIAVDVEFPTMIGATQTALLVAAPEEKRTTVRTVSLDDRGSGFAIAKRHQILAEQTQAGGRTIRPWKFRR
jgi:hypothetical protein